MSETPSALQQAIELLGGQTALAAALGVRTGHLFYWLKNRVPAEYCPAIERATGGQVRCEALRPDIDWAVLRGQPEATVEVAGA